MWEAEGRCPPRDVRDTRDEHWPPGGQTLAAADVRVAAATPGERALAATGAPRAAAAPGGRALTAAPPSRAQIRACHPCCALVLQETDAASAAAGAAAARRAASKLLPRRRSRCLHRPVRFGGTRHECLKVAPVVAPPAPVHRAHLYEYVPTKCVLNAHAAAVLTVRPCWRCPTTTVGAGRHNSLPASAGAPASELAGGKFKGCAAANRCTCSAPSQTKRTCRLYHFLCRSLPKHVAHSSSRDGAIIGALGEWGGGSQAVCHPRLVQTRRVLAQRRELRQSGSPSRRAAPPDVPKPSPFCRRPPGPSPQEQVSHGS